MNIAKTVPIDPTIEQRSAAIAEVYKRVSGSIVEAFMQDAGMPWDEFCIVIYKAMINVVPEMDNHIQALENFRNDVLQMSNGWANNPEKRMSWKTASDVIISKYVKYFPSEDSVVHDLSNRLITDECELLAQELAENIARDTIWADGSDGNEWMLIEDEWQEKNARYLELRGELERHPEDPTQVRIKPKPFPPPNSEWLSKITKFESDFNFEVGPITLTGD